MGASEPGDVPSDGGVEFTTQIDPASPGSITVDIVEALAAAADADATDVDPPLYEAVDTEALDALFHHASAHEDATWEFEFAAGEFDVTARSDGHIVVQ